MIMNHIHHRLTYGVQVECPQEPPPCPLSSGYTEMDILFDLYSNPFGLDQAGQDCDSDGTACDIVLSVCVRQINSRYNSPTLLYYMCYTTICGYSICRVL